MVFVLSNNEKEKKDKSLILRTYQSLGEGNFFDLPFIYPFRTDEPITYYEFVWFDKEKKRSIRVYGNKELGGIPTTFDYDVMIALFKILVQNNDYKFNYDYDTQKYEFEPVIEFTFRGLAKQLGIDVSGNKSLGGSNTKRLRESLERLSATVMFNTEYGGFYDITKKDYSCDKVTSIRFIYDLKYYTNNIDRVNSCKIDKFFLQSLQNSYFKIINYDLYLKIKSWYAKKLYVLLHKWQGGKDKIDLLYDTLYQRMPLPDDKPAYRRNEIIKRAADELVKHGYLTHYERDSKKCMISFYYNKDLGKNHGVLYDTNENLDKNYIDIIKSKYKFPSEIEVQLKIYGFSPEEIDEYIFLCYKSDTAFEYFKALMRYTEYRVFKNDVKDVKSFLKLGLKGVYNINPIFYDNPPIDIEND